MSDLAERNPRLAEIEEAKTKIEERLHGLVKSESGAVFTEDKLETFFEIKFSEGLRNELEKYLIVEPVERGYKLTWKKADSAPPDKDNKNRIRLNTFYDAEELATRWGVSDVKELVRYLHQHTIFNVGKGGKIAIINWRNSARRQKEIPARPEWKRTGPSIRTPLPQALSGETAKDAHLTKQERALALLGFLKTTFPGSTFNTEEFRKNAEVDRLAYEITKSRPSWTKGILLSYLIKNKYITIVSEYQAKTGVNSTRKEQNLRIV